MRTELSPATANSQPEGEKATDHTNLNSLNSFTTAPVMPSRTRHTPYRWAVASCLPSGEKAAAVILSPGNSDTMAPDLGSRRKLLRFQSPDIMRLPSGLYAALNDSARRQATVQSGQERSWAPYPL